MSTGAAGQSATAIKKIRGFSEDAIVQCMERVFTPEEKQTFGKLSEKLSSSLGTKSPAEKKTNTKKPPKIPTAEEVFVSKVLPQIEEKVKEWSEKELNLEKHPVLDLCKLDRNYSKLSLSEFEATHKLILSQEAAAGVIHLTAKFWRGIFYTEGKRRALLTTKTLDEWFEDHLHVNYNTASRYIVFSTLVRRCPRLIICGLSFDQLVKHSKSIRSRLENDDGFAAMLGVTTRVEYNLPQKVKIEAAECQIPGFF